jgi:hypothetical protein
VGPATFHALRGRLRDVLETVLIGSMFFGVEPLLFFK